MQRYCLNPLICVLFLFFLPALAMAEVTPGSLTLLPFTTDKAGKYVVLKDELKTMLGGRLAAKRGISVVENRLTAKEQGVLLANYPKGTAKIFGKQKVDYIAAGVLSVENNALKIELRVHSKKGDRVSTLQVVAENDKEIIAAIELLAAKIAEKLFDHAPRVAADKGLDKFAVGTEAFQTAHPDRKYKEEVISGVDVSSGLEYSSISKDGLLRRRSSLKDGVVTLTVGDVDGAGGEEIVVVSEESLKIFHYDRGLLKKLSEYDFDNDIKVHAVNLGDLDNDNIPEIYISATDDSRFNSLILQWQKEAGFVEVLKDIRWAIRPYTTKEEGKVLLGQRQSQEVEKYLESGIHVLNLDLVERKISKARKLFLPARFNLFDFVFADIDGNGTQEKAGITSNQRLAVYDSENRLIWISGENFGGSVKYLGRRWRTESGDDFGNIQADDENYVELEYIPPRLVALDVDGDGKEEIISAKNDLSTFEVLANFRSYNSGRVTCLSWNDGKMGVLWQTDTVDGYIADLEFVKLNAAKEKTAKEGGKDTNDTNDTNIRLVVGQVPSGGFTNILNFLGDKANLIVYEFKILRKSASTKNSQN